MARPTLPLTNIPPLGTGSTSPIPDAPFRSSSLHPGHWMYERIAKSIIEFEKKLDRDKEIGARLVNFANGETISIDDVGFWGTDLITFYGKNADGHKVELLQHISQVNVLLVAVPAKGEPNRIGFLLEQRLEKKAEE